MLIVEQLSYKNFALRKRSRYKKDIKYRIPTFKQLCNIYHSYLYSNKIIFLLVNCISKFRNGVSTYILYVLIYSYSICTSNFIAFNRLSYWSYDPYLLALDTLRYLNQRIILF